MVAGSDGRKRDRANKERDTIASSRRVAMHGFMRAGTDPGHCEDTALTAAAAEAKRLAAPLTLRAQHITVSTGAMASHA
jgi:hypothetical protein